MSDALVLAIITAITSIVSGGIAAYAAIKISKVGTRIDGRMDELLEINKKASKAEGKVEEKFENAERQIKKHDKHKGL